ncbi:MAG: CoA transferase [Myxococcales bacterium]
MNDGKTHETSPASSKGMPAAAGPLEGVRVVDMTTVVMGPYATQILGDYGADVIKVEPPEGDIMRNAGPLRSPNMGHLYLQMNRNKRGIVLDVKKEGGRAALLRLCERADVFVHNVRPAAMDRLLLSYDALRAANPRIVYVGLVGYGAGGPYAGKPAYDDLIQGICGLPTLIAQATSGEPRYVPSNVADRIVGTNAVHAILAALLCRARTGEGQAVELPMFETLANFLLGDHMGGRTFEPALGPPGYTRLLHRRPYQTRDGYLCVLVYNDRHWEAFFRAIGRLEQFASDRRLSDYATRSSHYEEVYGILAGIFAGRTNADWIALLEEIDIPCVRLNTLDGLIDDEHLAAVGFFRHMDHPSEGAVRMVGPAGRWSASPPGIRSHAPGLGEHSVEVLREAGFDETQIAQLIAEGATRDGRPALPDKVPSPSR